MISYKQVDYNEIKQTGCYIWGAGDWGRRCLNLLNEKDIPCYGFIDGNCDKIGKPYLNKMVYSSDVLSEIVEQDIDVIVAMEHFAEVLSHLGSLQRKKVYIDNCIYCTKEVEIFGTSEISHLKKLLENKDVYVVGSGKYLDDFMYVFNNYQFKYISYDEISIRRKNDYLIVCDFEMDRKTLDILESKDFVYEKSYIYGEELAVLFDDNRTLGSDKIPSIMFSRTLHDSMKNQPLCYRPFTSMQVGARFSVHCCCPDWSEGWGNLLCSDFEEIWKSPIAKIFRLSVINRTYTFCNPQKCVNMNVDVKATDERMFPVPLTPEYPKSVELGIDYTCNLYCKSCRDCVRVANGKSKGKIDLVKNKIIESKYLDKVNTLLLGGDGEVFFSDVYKDLMFNNAERRKNIDIRTNGTLLEETYLNKLVELYEDVSIIVSIDAVQKETYEKLRRSNNKDTWNNLQCNLEMLSQYRIAKKISFFQINMCVQMMNYKEIPEFINKGMELGCDRVYITPIRNWGTYSASEFENVGIFKEGKQLKDEVRNVLSEDVLNNPKVLIAF